MVSAGAYRDSLPGKPGEAVTGGGTFEIAGKGVRRRMYQRCSAEYAEALKLGVVDRLPALLPATEESLVEAEELIGFPLPTLLRRLYKEVANGGFGPAYGTLGVRGGHADDRHRTAVDLYLEAKEGRSGWRFLPATLLPLCHWGCGIYSFVDCSASDGAIWAWDPNPGPDDERALFRSGMTIEGWLAKWVACDLIQPTLVQEGDGSWRGATNDEVRAWFADLP